VTAQVAALVLVLASTGFAAEDPVPRVAIQDPGDAAVVSRLAAALGEAAVPIAVRVPVNLENAATEPAEIESRLAAYEAAGVQLWPVIDVPRQGAEASARWRAALTQWLGRHRGRVAILELRVSDDAIASAKPLIQMAATDLRVGSSSAQIAVGGPIIGSGNLSQLLDATLTPYVDLIAGTSRPDVDRTLERLKSTAPALRGVLVEQHLPDSSEAARDALIELHIASLASAIVAVAADGESRAVEAGVSALRPLAALLTGEVEAIDAGASSLRLSANGVNVVPQISHRLLFENRTFGTYLFYRSGPNATPLDVAVSVPIEGTPVVIDLARGTQGPAAAYDREGQTVHVQAPQTGRAMLLDFNADASEVFAQRSDVSAERLLSVDEIIARHRIQQASQDNRLQHYSARVLMEQHFRPTVADPGYDVVTENRYFSGSDGVEWEELSFSVNGSHWGANRPPFPLLQPEKVLSLPLQLRFGEDYRYRLEGVDKVDGFDCYVVAFDPVQGNRSLYRGTVWIDRRTFARIRVKAVQTNLSAPVVSNEETQRYRPVSSVDGQPIFLFEGLTARQIVMIAGRNLLVEKSVTFSDFVVNGGDFTDTREAARRGDRIMYRETDQGLRYYVKQDGTRVVSERATQEAKAMAMGVTIDPSFAFPLPIFGINYLNFALGGRQDSQLAMLFAGVLAAINVQRPKIAHTPFDASLDLFVIAVPSSDRVHDATGERPAERVITWPETTGLNFGWQFTPFQKATFQYQFRFDGYHKDTTTSDEFQVPSSTTTNGIGGAYEYRRAGYSFVANGAWFRRAGWKPWGLPDPAAPGGTIEPVQPTYVRYSGSLSRDVYLGLFQKLHFNAAYFGGEHLDRFSRYQFGLFDDTRIHGVPASGLRFDDLAMVRGSYTFNIFEQYRIDLFLERASGRDRDASPDWQSLTGTGIALNVRAPFGTILRADIGHSFLPSRYRGIGSTVVQIMFLKPLGGP
jgi:hypothetical protein